MGSTFLYGYIQQKVTTKDQGINPSHPNKNTIIFIVVVKLFHDDKELPFLKLNGTRM